MQTEKVHFTKEKETMLVTLYGRALETDVEDPILRDPAAQEAVRRIDYDFQTLNVKWNDRLAIAARAKMFDLWTQEFLANNPPASVQWFDVDYPEIIQMCKRLFPNRHLIVAYCAWLMIAAQLSLHAADGKKK